jgi:hypothetical protein
MHPPFLHVWHRPISNYSTPIGEHLVADIRRFPGAIPEYLGVLTYVNLQVVTEDYLAGIAHRYGYNYTCHYPVLTPTQHHWPYCPLTTLAAFAAMTNDHPQVERIALPSGDAVRAHLEEAADALIMSPMQLEDRVRAWYPDGFYPAPERIPRRTCPRGVLYPGHYSIDGGCRCVEPLHTRAGQQRWGIILG